MVDAAATGHVISQLDAPSAIQELVQVGPIRNQTDWMVELLSDPALTALNVVTSPEEMPVNETIELVARRAEELERPARRGHREPCAARAVHPRRRGGVRRAARARAAARCSREHAGAGATAVLDAAAPGGVDAPQPVGAPGALREQVDLPLLLLPYLFVRDHGLRVTRMVAEALGQELG